MKFWWTVGDGWREIGGIEAHVLYAAQDLCRARGLSFEDLYQEAYPNEISPDVIMGAVDGLYEHTSLPQVWGDREIALLLRDLRDIDFSQLGSALERAIYPERTEVVGFDIDDEAEFSGDDPGGALQADSGFTPERFVQRKIGRLVALATFAEREFRDKGSTTKDLAIWRRKLADERQALAGWILQDVLHV